MPNVSTILALTLPEAVVTAPLALDGFTGVGSVSGATITLSLTTTKPNDVVIVNTGRSGGNSVLSISDTAGLTWISRYNMPNGVVVFYAVAPMVLTADTITITFDYAGGNTGWAFAVNGVNTAAPWDANVGVPSYTAGAGATTTGSYSTTNANDFVFELTYLNTGGATPPAGFAQIGSTSSPSMLGFFQIVSSPQSSVNVTQGQYPSFVYLDALVGGTFVSGIVDLFGDISPSVTLTGDASITSNLQGDVAPQVQFAGDLTFSPNFVGDIAPQITLTADLNFLVDAAGGVTPVVSLGGDLSTITGIAPVDLSGNVSSSIALTGDLTFYRELAGDISPATTLGSDLSLTGSLVGDVAPSVTFTGDLSFSTLSLAGNIFPQVTIAGNMFGDVFMLGDMDPAVTFAGDLSSGPLWKPVPPCDDPVWEEAELCPG